MTCKNQHLSRNKQDRSEDLNLKIVQNKEKNPLYLHARSLTEATCVVIEIFNKWPSSSDPTFSCIWFSFINYKILKLALSAIFHMPRIPKENLDN